MIEVKVFGSEPPCAKCKQAEGEARKAAEKFPGQVTVTKYSALLPEALELELLMTPAVPACSGGVAVRRLIDDVAAQYGDQMDVVYHQGRDERYEELKLSSAPAIIVGDLVRFIGLCPTKEGLIGALREAGLD